MAHHMQVVAWEEDSMFTWGLLKQSADRWKIRRVGLRWSVKTLPKMLKRLAAPASCSSCLLAFLLAFVSPKYTLSIGADKTMVNKEDYYSATVNATVLDHKGNPQQMVTKNDGRYGQNSPKTEAKGIVIAPAAVNGGECVYVHWYFKLVFKNIWSEQML